jgi:hypothetical protein
MTVVSIVFCGDISSTTSNPVIRGRLLSAANRVFDACAGQVQEFDLERAWSAPALLEFRLL